MIRRLGSLASTQSGDEQVSPTLMWYYYICHREVWLMAHNIKPDQEDKNVEIGRTIHENSYSRNKKEISLPGMRLDVVSIDNGEVVIGEIKKSSKSLKASEMQLLYYLYMLNKNNVTARGRLYFPKEKRNVDVDLDQVSEREIEEALEEIRVIIEKAEPPKARKISFCKNCAYRELCWS